MKIVPISYMLVDKATLEAVSAITPPNMLIDFVNLWWNRNVICCSFVQGEPLDSSSMSSR